MKNDLASPAGSSRARALREAFDATFARPPPAAPAAMIALLILRAGGERVAVRRDEMSGLVRAENNVAPVPGPSPAFLGLAGLQGELRPVWRLGALLDGGARAASAPGRDTGWLVLADARADAPCAFACEAFERLVFVPETALFPASSREARPGLVRAMASWDGVLLPVVDLPALQAEIHRRHKPSTLSSP